MKTFSRIVRRRLEGALRLRLTGPQRDELAFRPAIDPLREDIPVEVISLDAPDVPDVSMLSARRTGSPTSQRASHRSSRRVARGQRR